MHNNTKATTASDEGGVAQRYPLFQLKTNGRNIEITVGPSLTVIVIALITAKLAIATTVLAVFGASGAVLISWAIFRHLRQ